MKKFVSGVLIGVITALSIGVFAASGIKQAFFSDDIKLMVNGEQVKTEILSVIKEGQVNTTNYVSARALGEALGQKVEWNGAAKTINVISKTDITESDSIEGVWKGYYCNSTGNPNLTLTISKMPDDSYTAKFEFNNTTEKVSGSYWMSVDYDKETKKINMKGTRWISRPTNWIFIDLVGSVSGDYINGASIAPEDRDKYNGDFSIKRSN